MRSRLLPAIMVALLGLGIAACEVEEGADDDPLMDDPGLEEPADDGLEG